MQGKKKFMDQSYRTATTRKVLSSPMSYLLKFRLLQGRMLDYGCGRGSDADFVGMEKYDPHWFPERPKGLFDVITCNYVLNVIRLRKDRDLVVEDILDYLKPNGRAYVTVRRDIKGSFFTSFSWQGNIQVPHAKSLKLSRNKFEIFAF